MVLLFPSVLASLLLLAGCDSSSTQEDTPCDIEIEWVKPYRAYPGDRVTLSARPLTDPYDTAVYIGSHRATVLEIDTTGCSRCESCLDDEGCDVCEDCDTCDPYCDHCLEMLSFEVPEADPGETVVQFFNRHGESDSHLFYVRGDTTEDTGDTGTTDTGDTADTGTPDTGPDTGETGDTGDTGAGHGPDTGDSGETGDTGTLPVETGDTATTDTG